jgi:hypothetical protein
MGSAEALLRLNPESLMRDPTMPDVGLRRHQRHLQDADGLVEAVARAGRCPQCSSLSPRRSPLRSTDQQVEQIVTGPFAFGGTNGFFPIATPLSQVDHAGGHASEITAFVITAPLLAQRLDRAKEAQQPLLLWLMLGQLGAVNVPAM